MPRLEKGDPCPVCQPLDDVQPEFRKMGAQIREWIQPDNFAHHLPLLKRLDMEGVAKCWVCRGTGKLPFAFEGSQHDESLRPEEP